MPHWRQTSFHSLRHPLTAPIPRGAARLFYSLPNRSCSPPRKRPDALALHATGAGVRSTRRNFSIDSLVVAAVVDDIPPIPQPRRCAGLSAQPACEVLSTRFRGSVHSGAKNPARLSPRRPSSIRQSRSRLESGPAPRGPRTIGRGQFVSLVLGSSKFEYPPSVEMVFPRSMAIFRTRRTSRRYKVSHETPCPVRPGKAPGRRAG